MNDPFASSFGPSWDVWNRSGGDGALQQFDRMWPATAWMGPEGQFSTMSFDLVEHPDRFVFIAGRHPPDESLVIYSFFRCTRGPR